MSKSLADLVKEAKSRINEISAEQLNEAINNHAKQIIVDVREPGEYQAWRIHGALSIPRGVLEVAVDLANPDRNKLLSDARSLKVVLYCGTGGRSALAADVLQTMGFGNVESLAGGITNWRNMGFDIDQ